MTGLEALESLVAVFCDLEIDEEGFPKWFLTGKRGEEYLIIKKELKALEIIKEKQVDVFDDIIDSWSYEEYVDNFNQVRKNGYGKTKLLLIEEEYDLLREVLCEKL